jgi:four helix bundle protein
MQVRSYRDLTVWQRSLDFIAEVYELSSRFPAQERFALTTQLRKAAVSVSSNIAEGSGRATSRDLLNFLTHSRGSLSESESLLFVAQRLRFATNDECAGAMELGDEVGRMLSGLRTNIGKYNRKPSHR